jgi:hypothetical protein
MGKVPAVLALGALLVAGFGTASAVSVTTQPALDRLAALTYLTDGTAGAGASVAACIRAEGVLVDHGWRVPRVIVRIEANPFDATAAPAEVALSSAASPDDNAFALSETLIRRSLPAIVGAPLDAIARVAATHLAVPSPRLRLALEREWLSRVGGGDVLSTALPELLWRSGGDQAMRDALAGPWPEAALAVLRERGCEDPLGGVAELVLAGLLQPSALGFAAPSLLPAALPAATTDRRLSLTGPGARFLVLPTGSGAVGVEPLRCDDGSGAWLAVRYALTGDYDIVKLGEGRELAVPLQGVEWAAIVVVSLAPTAGVSLNIRAISDFPQQLARWDFVATPGAASLSWETESHRGLSAYVVEALSRSQTGAWSVVRRVIIPVADDGSEPFGYAFVDPEGDVVAAYRLLALTEDGLLGEVSTFPVPES